MTIVNVLEIAKDGFNMKTIKQYTQDYVTTKRVKQKTEKQENKLKLKDYAYLTALGIGTAGLTADFLIQLTNRLGG